MHLFTGRAVSIAAAPLALVQATILPVGTSAFAPVLRPRLMPSRLVGSICDIQHQGKESAGPLIIFIPGTSSQRHMHVAQVQQGRKGFWADVRAAHAKR